MKNLTKTTLAIALTALLAGPASAMVSKSDISSDINSVMGNGSSITVFEKDGVVTLTGYYEDAGDQAAALAVVERAEGVDRVINLAFPAS